MKVSSSARAATTRYYEEHAAEYFQRTVSADMSPFYDKFLCLVPAGGLVLDAGCGSGRDLKEFLQRGFHAQGIDSSPRLVEMARSYSGAPCSVGRLEEINAQRYFDGIWACASLVHFQKAAIVDVLRRLREALVPEGVLFVSVQEGAGEQWESDGRFFAYYSAPELRAKFESAGFTIKQIWGSEDALHDRPTKIRWLNALVTA